MAFCYNCGCELKEGAKFCYECGEKIDFIPKSRAAKNAEPESEPAKETPKTEKPEVVSKESVVKDSESKADNINGNEDFVIEEEYFDEEEDIVSENEELPAEHEYEDSPSENTVSAPKNPQTDEYWDDVKPAIEDELYHIPKEVVIRIVGISLAIIIVIAWLIYML